MIVTPMEGQLLVFTQHDHAHFAGELLSLWRADGLPEHPRRRELLFAAREHDNGWREADSAPRYRQADGRPHDFLSVPGELRREIWHRGAARYLEREPYAARLILRHARHLHRSHQDDPDWSELLESWRQLEADLAAVTGVGAGDFADDYRWIELTDSLSLAACDHRWKQLSTHGFTAELRSEEPGVALSRHTLIVKPFPLAGATTLQIDCRLIPNRTYTGDADLGTELATARWQRYAVRVAADAPAHRV